MKTFILLLIFLYLTGCASPSTSVESKESTGMNGSLSPTSTPTTDPESLVLSTDYSVAERALRKAIVEKDSSTIRKGLKSQFTGIKIEAVKALSELNDASSIPQLVETLKLNQGVIDGGSEMQGLQNELNKAIVLTLEQLTGLEFVVTKRLAEEKINHYKPFSVEEIEEVEKRSREWWKDNQPGN